MARIPDHELEQLKTSVSLIALVEAKGIALVRHGADWHGHCPFHNDKTPSLVISPTKNLWHCLGACQIGGSVIDWVMKAEGVSFRHAVELLRNDLPVSTDTIVRQSTKPKLAAPVSADADDAALLQQVIGYYHSTLKQSPEALAYLQSRGLHHPDVIDHFQLGFANRTLGLRLPAMNRKAVELGMFNTRFVDATGLSSDNVSTAEDLVKMVKGAYEYPLIREFTTTGAHEVATSAGRNLQFRNSNGLVRNSAWEIGLSKTGYISDI